MLQFKNNKNQDLLKVIPGSSIKSVQEQVESNNRDLEEVIKRAKEMMKSNKKFTAFLVSC